MAYGHWEGKDASHPEVRALFTREALLASDWYKERLASSRQRDVALWQRHVRSLTEFLATPGHRDEAERLGIPARLDHARRGARAGERARLPERSAGTIGADPIHRPVRGRAERGSQTPDARELSAPIGAGR